MRSSICKFRSAVPHAQQTLESLAILAELRFWADVWQQRRVGLTIRSNNYTALWLLAKIRGRSEPLNKIARELGIALAEGCFRPDIIKHPRGFEHIS
eukprot:5722879-Amphidinium_carterae.2